MPPRGPRGPIPWRTVLVTAASVGLIVGLVAGGLGGLAAHRTPVAALPAQVLTGGGSPVAASRVAGVVAAALPGVVTVRVPGAGAGERGSGFVLRADGYVVTNRHVVDAAGDGGTVAVTFADGATVDGRVVGTSDPYDLAVVKVPRRDLTALALGDSTEVRVGDTVVAIGSPLGLAGTVTTGIVSARDRPVTTDKGYLDTLQTDAAINPGSSGGPLLDSRGKVVGITWVSPDAGGSVGLGFAIPSNVVRRVAADLAAGRAAPMPVIGVRLDPAQADGPATVLSVDPGGPAAAAGLQPGDVLQRVDGRRVPDARALIGAIRDRAPGDEIELTVVRGFRQQVVRLTLGSSSSD